MTIGHDQKNAGPPRPIPTPKLPNDPVETLMKLNAIAKFERKPSVRRNSGLIPSDKSWASSRAATSSGFIESATGSSSFRRRLGAAVDLRMRSGREDAGHGAGRFP